MSTVNGMAVDAVDRSPSLGPAVRHDAEGMACEARVA